VAWEAAAQGKNQTKCALCSKRGGHRLNTGGKDPKSGEGEKGPKSKEKLEQPPTSDRKRGTRKANNGDQS